MLGWESGWGIGIGIDTSTVTSVRGTDMGVVLAIFVSSLVTASVVVTTVVVGMAVVGIAKELSKSTISAVTGMDAVEVTVVAVVVSASM